MRTVGKGSPDATVTRARPASSGTTVDEAVDVEAGAVVVADAVVDDVEEGAAGAVVTGSWAPVHAASTTRSDVHTVTDLRGMGGHGTPPEGPSSPTVSRRRWRR